MKIAGINFPSPLLSALRDGELVIFAGAGVSMGEPACLPSFKELAEKIAQGTGEVLREKKSEREPEDHFLGRLHSKGVKVHELAGQELSRNNPTDLHRDLLRLYQKNGEQVRVVTTNFDLLFEAAAQDVFSAVPEVFRAPALPLGRDFNGIVHVHGALSHRQGIVLTDEDFGRAYLTEGEGWARRFLVELFRHFPVLFVGYSHKDIILNYLARALPPDETKPRFALTDGSNSQRWKLLGIEPVIYPQSEAGGKRASLAIYHLKRSDLPEIHPDATAKLVLYIRPSLPPTDLACGHEKQIQRDLIGRLLKSPLPPELKTKLQELDAQLIN